MKRRYAGLVVGVCALCAGCQMAGLAACNLGYEAWLEKEHAVAWALNRKLAEQALQESYCSNTSQVHSVDYDRGFIDGYAGYLNAKCCLTPPALPPKHYWSTRYQTPQGHQAIEDWFLGYQHGAQAARASGRREFITVPVLGPTAASIIPPAEAPVPEAAGSPSSLPSAASPFPLTSPAAVQAPAPRAVEKE